MINSIYQLIILLLSWIVWPIFLLFARGRDRLAERYGSWTLTTDRLQPKIWIHAASAGEVNGALPFIEQCEREGFAVLLTTTSVTGLQRGAARSREAHLVPFDHPLYLRRALKDLKITALVVVETEIWPSLLTYAVKRNIPVCFLNARISDYTVQRYQLLKTFFQPLLSSVSAVCVADAQSLARFQKLGAGPEKVYFTGSTKYDHRPSVTTSDEREQIHARFFSEKHPILILGSIHPGEDVIWFDAIARCLKRFEHFNVIVAPRHQEKFEYFSKKLTEFSLEFRRFSTNESNGTRIVLFDQFGGLEKLYSIATLAFIGGSLVDIGGHNPLEAAAYGIPITMGQYTSTVREIVDDLGRAGALERIETVEQAITLIEALNSKQETLIQRGRKALEVAESHRGATERSMVVIRGVLQQAANGGVGHHD